ncbi:MAG: ABC transporter permease [Erysipelotrichaceae bacterium]|jgi:oligopeptide transport system permease protein|nr:ABC transporter permease [Erysipelotrichaceae bacterium]
MAFYLIGYSIIFFIIALVIFIELVAHRIIYKDNAVMQRIFGHPLLRYSLRRVGSSLITILLAVIATFFLIRAGYASEMDTLCHQTQFGGVPISKLPPQLVEDVCVRFEKDMGFAGSPFEQLGFFLYSILPFPKTLCTTSFTLDSATGEYLMHVQDCRFFIMDLGKIFNTSVSGDQKEVYVIDFVFQKMAISFPVGILAVLVDLGLGYPLGLWMAKHKDGIPDKLGNAYIITVGSIPGVAYYYILLAVFVGIFSLPSVYNASDPLSYIAPVLTLGLAGLTGTALWVRRYMVDEFNSDYVKFARAKGLSENRIMGVHVMRNAIVPLIRSIPASVLFALLGSFFVEKIYNIQGIGNLLINANASKEFFAIQGVVIIEAFIAVIAYLLGDIVTAVADPRISLSKE